MVGHVQIVYANNCVNLTNTSHISGQIIPYESSGDTKKMINQPKNVQHCFNIVSKFAHTMDNDIELVTLMQPLIGNPSLVATKGLA